MAPWLETAALVVAIERDFVLVVLRRHQRTGVVDFSQPKLVVLHVELLDVALAVWGRARYFKRRAFASRLRYPQLGGFCRNRRSSRNPEPYL